MTSLLFLLPVLWSAPYTSETCGAIAPIVKEGKRWKVTLDPRYYFKGTDSYLYRVRLYTRNQKFANYLAECKARPAEWIEELSKGFDCVDIFTPKLFLYYERQLGLYLQHKYWMRTKRWVRVPDIMVEIEIASSIRCWIP